MRYARNCSLPLTRDGEEEAAVTKVRLLRRQASRLQAVQGFSAYAGGEA